MAVYSIKDLEKLSGIKAHTIRIWEKRYEIVNPKRTPTNIRYYDDEDLKYLLNIALLNKNGIKISKIAKMNRGEIAEKVAAISEINFEYGTQLDALTLSMIEMDEYKFDRIIRTNIDQLGFEKTMIEVFQPFLDKLSLLWLTGSVSPVQEHFISYLIRRKIICSIDNEPLINSSNTKSFIVYLPEGERQELSLLFLHYLLRARRFRVIYLGQDITLGDLQDAKSVHEPDFVFTMVTETFSKEPLRPYLEQVVNIFPNSRILLSGYQAIAQRINSDANVQVLKSLPETIEFLDGVRNQDGKDFFS
ncbi:MAG: MerR family transcriptional regulator [Saprospiraceae bacterium]